MFVVVSTVTSSQSVLHPVFHQVFDGVQAQSKILAFSKDLGETLTAWYKAKNGRWKEGRNGKKNIEREGEKDIHIHIHIVNFW